MRHLYLRTNGKSNALVSKSISFFSSIRNIDIQKSLFDPAEIDCALEALKEEGFYIFKRKLPTEVLETLVDFGVHQPCRAMVNQDPDKVDFTTSQNKQKYDSTINSPKFLFDVEDLINNATLFKLMSDSGLRSLGARYLQAEPRLDALAMWWSQYCGGQSHSSAAQLYHFDMDRLKFLKIFFYLTNVTSETGPHCFVRKSHLSKPKPLRIDGRIPDKDIHAAYRPEDIIELCGTAGTVLAVDTSGFHKGKNLLTGERLIFQFQMSNSLFGGDIPYIPMGKVSDIASRDSIRSNPGYFKIVR